MVPLREGPHRYAAHLSARRTAGALRPYSGSWTSHREAPRVTPAPASTAGMGMPASDATGGLVEIELHATVVVILEHEDIALGQWIKRIVGGEERVGIVGQTDVDVVAALGH